MRLPLICLLLVPAAAHAFPKSTLIRGVLRIDSGDLEEGVADLESIRDNAEDSDARPKDVAKLFAYLSFGHVRLAQKKEGDVAHHLDVAFADWTRCVESSDKSAALMVKRCRRDADMAALVTFNRAATIANALLSRQPGGSRVEARTRCDQVAAYVPESLMGVACRAVVARAIGDTAAAQESATKAADRADAMGEVDSTEAPRLDMALAMGIQALLYGRLDVDGANALIARGDALKPKLGGRTLASVEQLRPVVADFGAKLVPARAAALDGTAHDAWVKWLGTTIKMELFDIAVPDATKAAEVMGADAEVQELVGVAFQNAAAARKDDPDTRVLKALLEGARDAFDRCLQAEALHPRCADHLEGAEGYLQALNNPE